MATVVFLLKLIGLIAGAGILVISGDSEVRKYLTRLTCDVFNVTADRGVVIVTNVVNIIRYIGVSIIGYTTLLFLLQQANQRYYDYIKDNQWAVITAILFVLLYLVFLLFSSVLFYQAVRSMLKSVGDYLSRTVAGDLVRRLLWGTTTAVVMVTVAIAALWYRLNSGPIELNIYTPAFEKAIESAYGIGWKVSIAKIQLERDENARVSLRLRDVKLRNAAGELVVATPALEIGLSGRSFILGDLRAVVFNYVSPTVHILIDPGRIVHWWIGDQKNQASMNLNEIDPANLFGGGLRSAAENVFRLTDQIARTGFGTGVREFGFKNAEFLIDDQSTGRKWTFEHVNVGAIQQNAGVAIAVLGTKADAPKLTLAFRHEKDRRIGIEAVNVPTLPFLRILGLDSADDNLTASVSAFIAINDGGGAPAVIVNGVLDLGSGQLNGAVRGRQTRVFITKSRFIINGQSAGQENNLNLNFKSETGEESVLQFESGRKISVTELEIDLLNATNKQTTAYVRLRGVADASSVLELVQFDPMQRIFGSITMDPSMVKGAVNFSGFSEIALNDFSLKYGLIANVSDLEINVGKSRIDHGLLQINADSYHFRLEGSAHVNGILKLIDLGGALPADWSLVSTKILAQ